MSRWGCFLLIVSIVALPSYGSWLSDRTGINIDANKAAEDAARASAAAAQQAAQAAAAVAQHAAQAAAAAAEQAAREAKKQAETNPAGVAGTLALGPGAATAIVAATSASNELKIQKDKTIEEGKQAGQSVVNDANSKATTLLEKAQQALDSAIDSANSKANALVTQGQKAAADTTNNAKATADGLILELCGGFFIVGTLLLLIHRLSALTVH